MAVVFSTIAVIAYANGDPVAKFSSIYRVANPEPLWVMSIFSWIMYISEIDNGSGLATR